MAVPLFRSTWAAGALAAFLALLITAPPRPAGAEGAPRAAYRLGSGDEVRLTVFGEDDLTGTYTVDGGGRLALPLVGAVAVGGLTARAAEDAIAARFADGYLRDPRVAVEVMTFGPFYILGEVQTPGAYAYAEGLTVLGAVALGGGFTYRADEGDIDITRGDADLQDVEATAPVWPGDVVRVRQRFF